MSNTIYNKVTFNNQTLIDLSQDTVTSAEHIVAGRVGHLADGTQVTGTGGGISIEDIATNTEPNGDIVFDGTSVGVMAFAGKPITSFIGPNVTQLGGNCFGDCSNLTTLSLPTITHWEGANFNNSTFGKLVSLTTLKIPNVNTIVSQSFTQMPLITSVVLPLLRSIPVNGFNTAGSGITAVDLGKNLATIGSNAFNGSPNILNIVILRRDDAVVTASATNSLPNNRVVTYYVPSALIEDYKVATNWSTRYGSGYAVFEAIEGSQYENYYADGTAIS